jgi:hypothetical protein
VGEEAIRGSIWEEAWSSIRTCSVLLVPCGCGRARSVITIRDERLFYLGRCTP